MVRNQAEFDKWEAVIEPLCNKPFLKLIDIVTPEFIVMSGKPPIIQLGSFDGYFFDFSTELYTNQEAQQKYYPWV